MIALNSVLPVEFSWSASDFSDLRQMLAGEEPDLLLLSFDLKGLDIFYFLSQVKLSYPALRIIVFISAEDIVQTKELLELGVNGVLSRQSDQDEIGQAVQAIMENDMYFNELINRALLHRLRRKALVTGLVIPRFTETEIRVLELLAGGYSNEEIAHCIFLSAKSVENIRYQLKIRTGVTSSTALVVYALRHRLIR